LALWAGSASAGDTSFSSFLQELWPDAQAKGISRGTFDAAFAGLSSDPRVIAATKRQPEYGKPIGAYVNSIASPARIREGAEKAAQWRQTLDAVEAKYPVSRFVLLAIWGIETSYGSEKDHWDVIRSLATLAAARYRYDYFRKELLVALEAIEKGYIPRKRMVGSWSGAMGQPQFMPSDYAEYAVDFDGDGKRDIWTSVPDVLASIANYLHLEGWNPDLPWGFEVIVPAGLDISKSRGTFAEWTERQVRRADGEQLPASGDAILFFPSGAKGPAFLVTQNFVVIKRYNNSDVYALAVAHLADRIGGRGPIRAAWPADDRQLSRDERVALQHKLKELGYPVREFAGHLDFDLRDAIREMQAKYGMTPDGHPTGKLLAHLGIAPRNGE
jgi:lytic murein transglycosylase